MQRHAAKHIYSPLALEFWFQKLGADWAGAFTPPQLALGRRIYHNDEIREIELTTKDAIIHRRVSRHDEYTVIEWTPNATLNIRSSTTDNDTARAIAVAGLHEIEELLADELPPLPHDPSESPPAENPPHQVATPAAAAAPRPRPLILTFDTSHNGLSFQAFWKNTAPDGSSSRTAAFTRPAAPRPGLTKTERSKLIGLAALARKSHFTYSAKTGGYLLLIIAEIPSFLKNTLPFWRRIHEIEIDPQTDRLFQAIQPVEISAIATRAESSNTGVPPVSSSNTGILPVGSSNTSVPLVNPSNTGILPVNPSHTSVPLVNLSNTPPPPVPRAPGTLNLRWLFKAGERLLTDAEIALVTKRGPAPTLLPGVGIVSLPTDRLETLKNWQRTLAEIRQPGDNDPAGALPPYLVFSLFNDARLNLLLSPEIENWRHAVLNPAPFTKTLPDILRPYQRRGVQWLHHLCDTGCHGLLADEMGLGKTLQVIALLAARPPAPPPPPVAAPEQADQAGPPDTASPSLRQTEIENRESKIENSLIVCPASVIPVWQEEFKKFAPRIRLKVLKTGNDFSSSPQIPPPAPGAPHSDAAAGTVWLGSYAQLRKHRAHLKNTRFAYAILDEGQFIKNPSAITTQTCFAIRAAHRIVLTGTPLENRQLDLWSIFRFLLPSLLGTRPGFEAALASSRENTLARLRAQIAPFILRRTKSEVAAELPPKIEMSLVCPLTAVQRSEYARVCSEGLHRLGNDMRAAARSRSFGLLALLTRLRQICCDPDMLPWLRAPLADSGKISLLVEKLSEILGNGHKVVVFSQFVMLLKRVHEALALACPGIPRHEITGMTKDRLKPVQSFQNTKGPAVMLVSLKAGGTGITLHAADYIFLLDPWWNPSVEAQAIDRVHRIGQANTVFVYRMVTAGTIEERIQSLKDSKLDLFDKLVGGLGDDRALTGHFKTLDALVRLAPDET